MLDYLVAAIDKTFVVELFKDPPARKYRKCNSYNNTKTEGYETRLWA